MLKISWANIRIIPNVALETNRERVNLFDPAKPGENRSRELKFREFHYENLI